jgi:hypothetical protein
MRKVMLIGDSIRMGYQARVAGLLAGKAAVTGPDENCRFSAYTLFNLSTWVTDDDYDVIQWNNGQWDTCYMPDGRTHTSLAAYLELQERIAAVLRKKAGRLIFATTTPVRPEQFTSGAIHPRRDEDIREYNAAAAELLGGLGVEINDLHAPVSEDVGRYISEDMVHLTEAGNDLCARRVAAAVDSPAD